MALPQSFQFEQRDVPLYTFGQLEQQPRQSLKSRAMNLRDLVGADRLPPLTAAGAKEDVLSWIIDVQCMLARSTGLEVTPTDLGVPRDFSMGEAGMMGGGGGGGGQGGGGGRQEPFSQQQDGDQYAAMHEAAAHKARNQRGSNIFGGDEERAPKQYQQPRQPMQELVEPSSGAAMAAYGAAMEQAAATRARNQRGSNIFG